jgi:hypothetical protein
MTTFAFVLFDPALLLLAWWLWRTGKAERQMRASIREITADVVTETEGTA